MTRASVFVFATLWVLAMWTYPGWNAFDANSTGHAFFRNYLCDLLASTTPDGRMSLVASLAMNGAVVVLVAFGLMPLWWRVPKKWRITNRVLGGIAAVLTLTLCVEQAFGLDLSHHWITLGAGAAGLVPTCFVATADWRSSRAVIRTLIVIAISASVVNFASYTIAEASGDASLVVPVAQKVALLAVLAWLYLRD